MPVSFTIGIICHADMELLEKTIPQNIDAICSNTNETFDVILIVDGAESVDKSAFIKAADGWGVDEVRFRWRHRNCASGDPSNNGHLHLLSNKTPYLLSLEGDVALFKLLPDFDILAEFRQLFERHPQLAVATRMDDHDCWAWKLEEVGTPFEDGVTTVNRVASHFLVYDTARYLEHLDHNCKLQPDIFIDDPDYCFNYEDYLSKYFAQPSGPGIAYVEKFPINVYHCDEKIEQGSMHYSKSLKTKCQVFDQRAQKIEMLIASN